MVAGKFAENLLSRKREMEMNPKNRGLPITHEPAPKGVVFAPLTL